LLAKAALSSYHSRRMYEMAMNSYKRLQILGSTMQYIFHGEVQWTLPLENLVLIAEYTTNEGPYVDDYFLVFVTMEEGAIFFSRSSFYSEGRAPTLKELANWLGTPLEPSLTGADVGAREWNSRVVWPPQMAAKQYFTFTKAPPPDILEKLKNRVLGSAYEYAISQEVREYIETQRAKRARSRD
jgi:hypothetical protein